MTVTPQAGHRWAAAVEGWPAGNDKQLSLLDHGPRLFLAFSSAGPEDLEG